MSKCKKAQPEWQLIRKGGFVPDPWPIRRGLRKLPLPQAALGQVIVDKTIGWKNGRGPGRKLLDHISVSQFVEETGLSRPTLRKHLEKLMETGTFLRVPSEHPRLSTWQYGIDFQWLEKKVIIHEPQRAATQPTRKKKKRPRKWYQKQR